MYRFLDMVELDGGGASEKHPQPQPQQISDMFQKFALAFKAKTYELFAEEPGGGGVDCDGEVSLLLDSAEEFIPDQKVVVIKPDSVEDSAEEFFRALVPSLFATVSSFEAAYLQFQAAHVPAIDRNAIHLADELIVSILQKLTDMKSLYRDSRKRKLGLKCGYDFPAGSIWEFQVQENQSKLRVLETVVNSLQSQIDVKDDEVRDLRKKLDQITVSGANLARKLKSKQSAMGSPMELSLTIRVFERILGDSIKSIRFFTKLLIDLMKRAGWNLEEAASSLYPSVDYTKKGHFRYAFMSYICLRMCQNFEKNDYGLSATEVICNEHDSKHCKSGVLNGEEENVHLKQLMEHIESSPMEILRKKPRCEFSQFCETKYEQLIHPTMESSIFSNLSRKEKVLDSWKSSNVFNEAFVSMASSIWLLHKLANSFNPVVEIFQLERGVEFSMIYMEDVTGKFVFTGKTKPSVGFTVVPGFKVGRTVIQSQVYLTNSKSTD